MRRAEELAADLEASYSRFADYLEGLSPDEWRTPGVNNPEVVAGEDEHRPVGVIAHHAGESLPMFVERAWRIAVGEPLEPISSAAMDAANARHAAVNPNPDQSETVAMLRDNSERAGEIIRGLSDEDLDRAGPGALSGFTAEQLVRRVVIGHVATHEGSIRAALQASGSAVGQRSQDL